MNAFVYMFLFFFFLG